jgi:hypothetical protein
MSIIIIHFSLILNKLRAFFPNVLLNNQEVQLIAFEANFEYVLVIHKTLLFDSFLKCFTEQLEYSS